MTVRWLPCTAPLLFAVVQSIVSYSGFVSGFVTTQFLRTRMQSSNNIPWNYSPEMSLRMADVQEIPRKKSVGDVGNWETLHGNYVLRPPVSEGQPRALLHFLGGAFVGAAPHVTYRYMLERLAARGYLIVATPYSLSFDHLDSCDAVIASFERIAPQLARQYGAVPVVGVGHSCGALLQLLICSLFPDTPRAANALISFNNKPVSDAVPFFDEIFAPLFTTIAGKNQTYPSGTEAMNLMLELARTATEGDLPSDELLSRISRFASPPELAAFAPDQVIVPAALREAVSSAIAPSSKAMADTGLLPLLNQAVETLEQIPLLVEEVSISTSFDRCSTNIFYYF